MKIVIAGGRDFCDFDKVEVETIAFIDQLNLKLEDVTIITGMARGADECGSKFAGKYNLPLIERKPDWDKWGRSAGIRRNIAMAEIADAVIVFWDGKSVGSKHMIEVSEKKGLTTKVIKYGEDILTFTSSEHRWLSNMALADIEHKGIIYPSVENFYQAMKYKEDFKMWVDNKIVGVREYIATLKPSDAKKFSRENAMNNPKFEENKLLIMKWGNYHKYKVDKYRSKLLNTYNGLLEEGNWWGDEFWGVDIRTREGENHLGRIIMEIRNDIRNNH